MAIAPCNLFKNSLEFRPLDEVNLVPPRTRGLYERHGFELLGTIQVGTSPPIFPMLRTPRR